MDNETHNVCNNRLAKEGGEARCCDCDPQINKWHNRFPRDKFDPKKDKIKRGFVERIKNSEFRMKGPNELETDYLRRQNGFLQGLITAKEIVERGFGDS